MSTKLRDYLACSAEANPHADNSADHPFLVIFCSATLSSFRVVYAPQPSESGGDNCRLTLLQGRHGFKELSEGSIAESKQAVDTLVADLKAIAAVKSPSEFFYLQLKLVKRNFDSAIALTEKNSQALGKLASVAALPITAQVKANVTKWRQVV